MCRSHLTPFQISWELGESATYLSYHCYVFFVSKHFICDCDSVCNNVGTFDAGLSDGDVLFTMQLHTMPHVISLHWKIAQITFTHRLMSLRRHTHTRAPSMGLHRFNLCRAFFVRSLSLVDHSSLACFDCSCAALECVTIKRAKTDRHRRRAHLYWDVQSAKCELRCKEKCQIKFTPIICNYYYVSWNKGH